MFRSIVVMGVALTLAAANPADADAQNPQTRQGFFISFGVGGGSFGCEDCGDRETGAAALIHLGGTLSPRLLLGADISGWSKSVEDSGGGEARLTHANLTAALQFYPSAAGGFWLKGGIGTSTLRAEASGGGVTISGDETGFGLTAGLGYDIRLGTNFSLTPYGSFSFGSIEGGSVNHAQLGLAATFH
jgi:hypothetical protein